MADNRLQLIVEVDTKSGNASIQGLNRNLAGMEKQAVGSARAASRGMDGMAGSLKKLLALAGGTAALVGAYRAIKNLVFGSIELQDELGKVSQRLGISVKLYSEFRHVAELGGLSAEKFGAGLGVLSKNMFEAARSNNVYRETFKQVGVEFKNADGTLRKVDEVILDMADRFKNLKNETEKVAIARSLMGRSGAELITVLNLGSEAIREQMEEARALGIVIGDETARQAAVFNDNMARIKSSLQGVGFQIAKELLPYLGELTDKMVNWVRDGGVDKMVRYLKEAAEWAKRLGQFIIVYGAISGILKLAAAARTAAVAIKTMNVAMLASPWGLAAAGVGILVTAMWRGKEQVKAFNDELERTKAAAGAAGNTLANSGLSSRDQIQIDLDAATKRENELWAEGSKLLAREAEIKKRFAELYPGNIAAQEKFGSRAAEMVTLRQRLGEIRQLIDATAQLRMKLGRELAGAAAAAAGVDTGGTQFGDELDPAIAGALENADRVKEAARRANSQYGRLSKSRADQEKALARQVSEYKQTLEEGRINRLATARDTAIRKLEAVDPQTVAGVLALESKKADIQIDYINQVHKIKSELFDRETEQLIKQYEIQAEFLRAAGENVSKIDGMIAELKRQRAAMRADIDAAAKEDIKAVRDNAAIQKMDIVRSEQRRLFDEFKRQAEGVFDALTDKSVSVFQAMGNALKTAILTAIKEIITSNIARALMRLFSGARISVGGGYAGAGGGILGAIPGIFGGGAGGGIPTTPPFIPSGGGGGGFSLGGFNLPTWSGFKNFIGLGPGSVPGPQGPINVPFGRLPLGAQLSQIATSDLATAGGLGLAIHGISNRNPYTGAIGGALLGARLGSVVPGLGTAVGAGIGAVAGAVAGLLRGPSPEDIVKRKIRDEYGISIGSKKYLTQIAGIAQQGFAGNYDAALRSPQVREIIRLYAMTTGQSTSKLPAKLQSINLQQSGGSLLQIPSGGFSSVPAALPGAALDSIAGGAMAGAGSTVINISIPGAKEFFEKETVTVVAKNPRPVQAASMNALQSNYKRREMATLQLSPSTITS